MTSIQRISVIGSGNVASALLDVLSAQGYRVSELIARNPLTGKMLAEKHSCAWVHKVQDMDTQVDLIILCVQDEQVALVSSQIPKTKSIVVHTSGSTEMSVLSRHTQSGVFYPLQTFSPNIAVNWSQVPIYLEACSESVEARLLELALKLSPHVYFLSSVSRMQLHVAAVFACNFTNLMMSSAADLMQQNGLAFSDLKQLVQCAVENAFMASHPDYAQTGPAIRNDSTTLQKHLNSLSLNPDLAEMYAFLSSKIQQKNKIT